MLEIERTLLTEMEKANPGVRIRGAEFSQLILESLDVSLTDVLSEPSGAIDMKFRDEAELLVKAIRRMGVTLPIEAICAVAAAHSNDDSTETRAAYPTCSPCYKRTHPDGG